MKSWYTIRARAPGAQGSRTEVLIYDEIGAYGVTAKGFLSELGALPGDAAIDLRLNSPGGSVFDAVAIYNALKRHAGEITVWIDGIAASAASYVAMAGDTIVMPENAFLMIHDPSGLVMGTAADMRATAEALDKVKGSLIQGYAAKSGKPAAEIAALMAAETWLDAKDALDLGFIDRMAEPVKLAASFDVARFRNAPPAVVEAVGETAEPSDGSAADGDVDDSEASSGKIGVAAGAVTPCAADITTKSVTPLAQANANAGAGAPDENTRPNVAVPAPAEMIPAVDTLPGAPVVRAEVLAHARTVIDLCRLAGQPQMAGRLLEDDVSIDEVRSRLLATKVDAVADITAAHAQPGRAATTQSWGDVIARTFKAKG